MFNIGCTSKKLLDFFSDESGAVTVDWVVLTASILLFGMIFVAIVKTGQDEIGEAVGTTLSDSAQTLPELTF